MKPILIILCSIVAQYASAQCTGTQPIGTTCACIPKYVYDNGGNRISRVQICVWAILRLAPNPKTDLSTESVPYTNEVVSIANIYPNPTNNEVKVVFSQPVVKATLQISNALGAVVAIQTVSGTEANVSLSDYASGVYNLTLIHESNRTTQRIVKTDK